MKCPGRPSADPSGAKTPAREPTKQDICASLHRIDLQKSHLYAWFCIAGILAVISLCFLAMSFKFNVAGKQNFAPKSMEFAVCCLTGGFAFLFLLGATIGIVWTNRKAKELKAELAKRKS